LRALGDATRREIVNRMMRRPQNVSALAGFYDMSFAAVQKHGSVLERAGLVGKERHGRETLVEGNPVTIRRARRSRRSHAVRPSTSRGLMTVRSRTTKPKAAGSLTHIVRASSRSGCTWRI